MPKYRLDDHHQQLARQVLEATKPSPSGPKPTAGKNNPRSRRATGPEARPSRPPANGAAKPQLELSADRRNDRRRVIEELHLGCNPRSRPGFAEELLDDSSMLERFLLERRENEQQTVIPLLNLEVQTALIGWGQLQLGEHTMTRHRSIRRE